MKLIVGLGNPGVEYVGTRHNFGFFMLDSVAAECGAEFRAEGKFDGLVATTARTDEKVFLLKPTTFYNLQGEAVRKLSAYYHIATSDILVIHDEMALPLGTIRTRLGGSDAGNNGIKNIIDLVGAKFARVRVGSGLKPTHDGDAQPTASRRDFVLGHLNARDANVLRAEAPTVVKIVDEFVAGRFVASTYKLNEP